ncbi:Hsp70 family protein [Granulicoccus sp. GXG6511]|uniref:Hsp70 family protein n=1 Tax=Granulicoccus sp. GXG6511 TaxID=3381351 RepID=UPI003D7D1168
MDLGVDFGTTRTITAVADRGNYPVVGLTDQLGDSHDWFPSVAALAGNRLVHGFEALAAAEQGAPLLRSFKRLLATPDFGPDTLVRVGDAVFPLVTVLESHLVALREALVRSGIDWASVTSTVISVPAHAHGPQRFWTLESFRRAGFPVTAMMNEPSAAGFEYTHRQPRTISSKRTRLIVYDLGGGTFDASLVKVEGTAHEVVDSLGVNALGGDDFDRVLADLALTAIGTPADRLSPTAADDLLMACREAKERLSPQTRRIALEAAGDVVVVDVNDFYAAATPLVEQSLAAMRPLLGGLDAETAELSDVAGIYLVGGGSGLPLVPRLLRERFGRRVHRSPYPAASTAIGLAIAADAQSGFSLTERLSRGFGVFREVADGRALSFDPILDRAAEVPADGEQVVVRRYRARHNVGEFRFVEYAQLDPSGHPAGDVVPFGRIVFPFEAALQREPAPVPVAVERRDEGPEVEERYVIDPNGIVTVRITDLDTGFALEESLAST